MVSGAVGAGVRRILLEMRQRFALQEARIAALDRKLDALAGQIQKTNEIVAVALDGLSRELRLIWGALGISLTVWLAVLGYLLTN